MALAVVSRLVAAALAVLVLSAGEAAGSDAAEAPSFTDPQDGAVLMALRGAGAGGGVLPPALALREETTEPPPKQEEVETTAPPEVETTTPPPVETPASILVSLHEEVGEQLHNKEYQWVNALLAFLFGAVLVWDGEVTFRWVVIGVVFLLAAVLAMSEVSTFLALDEKSTIRHVVGVEVGALAAYAAWTGIDGVMLVVGALLGGFVAFGLQGKLVAMGVTVLSENKGAIVALYSAVVLLSIAMSKRKKLGSGLAVLSAGIGGSLVTSAISWAVTTCYLSGYLGFLDSVFKQGLSAGGGGAWIDFLTLLLSSESQDKGLFLDSAYNFSFGGEVYRLDRVVGCSFWFVLFAIGAHSQLKRAKAPAGGVAKAREGLHRALLLGDDGHAEE
eukprot:CAMPEP_0183518720 /NCGR_PEP_ID=MMETSP0371-20130417/15642_1 /TAXON_ID=268820 /ORGANISM="Peridinium aciculiferum, Strain PAER-2" /LENGTH=387 /DNA_ID=CAMNT_0025716777 /DNA_START=8 /DNA_END=1171 /DNA_ORIENTATION=+